MAKIMFPDYDKSILSIAASVLKHYGVTDCPHKTLVELDEILAKNYKNVIVMLFDGLGTDAINYHLDENSFLKQNMLCSVSSVFPPTTTAATTSIQSGYSPIEHGWLGWDLYFKELDENVAVFRNTLQKNGEKAADYNVAGKYISCKSIFERIEEKNPDVKACYLSPFSSPAVESFSDIKQAVLKLGLQDGRKYIYTYNPYPDSDMHVFGVTSHAVHRKILEIDSLVKDISSQLEDSVVIVTADHGLIDSKMEFLEDYPALRNMLKRPASIEPRARSLFVKDGCKEDFKREFNKLFGDKFILMTKQEVYDSHLFGFGKPHPRAEEFIGDFLAVATDDLTLENYREDNPFIGVHAGIDEREVLVPFIVIEKKRK
ncbi:MAG: alkaline phosphatase family protein [Eubacterium sp.]